MKTSVYIATSLDGFIARANGALDWLPGGEGEEIGEEDYGYQEFMDSVDYLLMARAGMKWCWALAGNGLMAKNRKQIRDCRVNPPVADECLVKPRTN